jgi:hypothetical protein
MTAASSTPLLTPARGSRLLRARHLAELEAAFGHDSPLHQHVPALVASRGAVDRLLTRAQRLARR